MTKTGKGSPGRILASLFRLYFRVHQEFSGVVFVAQVKIAEGERVFPQPVAQIQIARRQPVAHSFERPEKKLPNRLPLVRIILRVRLQRADYVKRRRASILFPFKLKNQHFVFYRAL